MCVCVFKCAAAVDRRAEPERAAAAKEGAEGKTVPVFLVFRNSTLSAVHNY